MPRYSLLSKGRLRRHHEMASPPSTHPMVSTGSPGMRKRGAAIWHRELTTVLTTTMTTVGLADTSSYTTTELVSCLVTPSAYTYGSEGWGFESLRARTFGRAQLRGAFRHFGGASVGSLTTLLTTVTISPAQGWSPSPCRAEQRIHARNRRALNLFDHIDVRPRRHTNRAMTQNAPPLPPRHPSRTTTWHTNAEGRAVGCCAHSLVGTASRTIG